MTELYQASASRLVRLAHVLIGDRGAAEDIVQDAFTGLYWRWETLRDPGKALPYVRSTVLNSCRSALRRGAPTELFAADLPDFGLVLASAETVMLTTEQRRAVMTALRDLPSRQREVLVLRFYLDLSETEIATQMGIGKSSVRSAQHRALTALGRMLREVVMNRAERKTVERVVRAAIDDTATEVGPGDLTPLHLVPRTGTRRRGGAKPVRTRRAAVPAGRRDRRGGGRSGGAAASFGAASALRADRAEMTGPQASGRSAEP